VVEREADAARSLGPDGRQARITDLVLSAGSVSAQELAEAFGVSVMTIHRDLDELQRQGVLRKSRGVATAQPSGTFESNVEYRTKANIEAKRLIAQHACRHVEPGMSLLLDDSTTALQMLPHLAALAPLTIATNYLAALVELARLRDVHVVALGGHYDVQHDSFLGSTCVDAVESMRFDAAFVSTSAVSGGYAFHQEDKILAVKRAMVDVADRSHLLIDHTKLTRSALHRLLPLHRFTSVVVDAGVPARDLAALRENDVLVEVASGTDSGRADSSRADSSRAD
jgi:DeoR/GlpR family transcriptional regulator of sugar metabolism